MGDLLRRGSDWLEAQRRAHLASLVLYARGAETVSLLATVGRTVFEQTDEYGIVHRTETRDFLITAADLLLGGAASVPRAGDRIHESPAPGTTNVYEVMSPGDEPPFRYSDPHRVTCRVHTKFVTQLTLGPLTP